MSIRGVLVSSDRPEPFLIDTPHLIRASRSSVRMLGGDRSAGRRLVGRSGMITSCTAVVGASERGRQVRPVEAEVSTAGLFAESGDVTPVDLWFLSSIVRPR